MYVYCLSMFVLIFVARYPGTTSDAEKTILQNEMH